MRTEDGFDVELIDEEFDILLLKVTKIIKYQQRFILPPYIRDNPELLAEQIEDMKDKIRRSIHNGTEETG